MSADTAFNATMRSIFLLSTALPGRDVSGGGASAARFVSEDGKIKLFFPPPFLFCSPCVPAALSVPWKSRRISLRGKD